MEVLVIIVAILLIAALTARLAESRGRNFWIYFVFCVCIPVAAIVAVPYLLTRRRVAEDVTSRAA